MSEIYENNLAAIYENDQLLFNELSLLKELDYEPVFGKDELDINIKGPDGLLYKDVLSELQAGFDLLYPKYGLYPLLLIYGVGNAILCLKALQNAKHEKILIFENDIQILALSLHLFDFSEYIRSKRLCFFHTKSLLISSLIAILNDKDINTFAAAARLFSLSEYYDLQALGFKQLLAKIKLALKQLRAIHGNSPKSALNGILQIVANLPYQLSRPDLATLIKERAGKNLNAVLVSTGPSLSKQLGLLKKYQDKVVIFCADSAYPILKQQGIKPDYVFVLERTPNMGVFFKDGYDDKGTLFICLSVVHENVIKAMENRDYCLFNRFLDFNASLDLARYGELEMGTSVAHFGFEIARQLGFKRIVLIGQDLAYAKDGSSHPKDFYYGSNFHDKEKPVSLLAYGGDGFVNSFKTWEIFKSEFELYAKDEKKIKLYNATEGGVRIEYFIEKPFSKLCEKYFNTKKLSFAYPKRPANTKSELARVRNSLLNTLEKTHELYLKGEGLKSELAWELDPKNVSLAGLEQVAAKVSAHKQLFNENLACKEYLHSVLFELECTQAKAMAKYAPTKEDKANKLFDFVVKSREWLEVVNHYLLIFYKELSLVLLTDGQSPS